MAQEQEEQEQDVEETQDVDEPQEDVETWALLMDTVKMTRQTPTGVMEQGALIPIHRIVSIATAQSFNGAMLILENNSQVPVAHTPVGLAQAMQSNYEIARPPQTDVEIQKPNQPQQPQGVSQGQAERPQQPQQRRPQQGRPQGQPGQPGPTAPGPDEMQPPNPSA